jgi:hypothetical protein
MITNLRSDAATIIVAQRSTVKRRKRAAGCTWGGGRSSVLSVTGRAPGVYAFLWKCSDPHTGVNPIFV